MALTDETTLLTVDVWADVLCPWCYIAEARLAAAIDKAEHGRQVELRLHTFVLDPDFPTEPRPVVDYLSGKYGVAREVAEGMERKAARIAQEEGLPYEVGRSIRSSFDALRLMHLAAEHGVAWELMREVQREAFAGNPAAFDHDTLVEIGGRLGIPEAEARDVLASDRYTAEVHADHDRAVQLGATGVPFVVVGNRFGIPGAVSTEQYAAVIDEAWEQIDGER